MRKVARVLLFGEAVRGMGAGMTLLASRIADEILRQVDQRGMEKSICPSEVARALMPEDGAWQSLMVPVRRAAVTLAREGRIDILRKGRPVEVAEDPAALKGVIRLRRR